MSRIHTWYSTQVDYSPSRSEGYWDRQCSYYIQRGLRTLCGRSAKQLKQVYRHVVTKTNIEQQWVSERSDTCEISIIQVEADCVNSNMEEIREKIVKRI